MPGRRNGKYEVPEVEAGVTYPENLLEVSVAGVGARELTGGRGSCRALKGSRWFGFYTV